jgi:hypothetical protein
MENLHKKLAVTHHKRVSDGVWAAADAAHFVLGEFRLQVANNTLEMSAGLVPHFVFNPYALTLLPDSGFAISDWERQRAFVLDVIRESTGMHITWAGPGSPIELHLRPATCPVTGPESKPFIIGILGSDPSCTEWVCLRECDGCHEHECGSGSGCGCGSNCSCSCGSAQHETKPEPPKCSPGHATTAPAPTAHPKEEPEGSKKKAKKEQQPSAAEIGRIMEALGGVTSGAMNTEHSLKINGQFGLVATLANRSMPIESAQTPSAGAAKLTPPRETAGPSTPPCVASPTPVSSRPDNVAAEVVCPK